MFIPTIWATSPRPRPWAPGERYRLTGVSDVAALLPIGVIVDRGYPDYSYPRPWAAPFAQNYEAFIRARVADGGRVERFRVGAVDQFPLRRRAADFPTFAVRNLAANGEVWTGAGTRSLFPPLDTLAPDDIPDENACSTAIRLSYGAFDYFAAGDLTSNTFDGALPWRDVETPAAQAAGPVEVAVAAHHGMYDATGADVVRALRPRTWVILGWHAAHPSLSTLERLFSHRLYAGPREVFATGLSPANALAHARLTDRMGSRSGHVVVRVSPGGGDYRVLITDNGDESDRVVASFGPFASAPWRAPGDGSGQRRRRSDAASVTEVASEVSRRGLWFGSSAARCSPVANAGACRRRRLETAWTCEPGHRSRCPRRSRRAWRDFAASGSSRDPGECAAGMRAG